jgi:hypothetical protein
MKSLCPVILVSGLLMAACSGPDETASGITAAMDTAAATETLPDTFPAGAPVGERVNYYVMRLRPQLPIPINESTVMDAVNRNGLEIELHYQVVDRSVTAPQLEAWMADNAVRNTCTNPMTAQMVRDGARFRYTFSGGALTRPISRVVANC